MEVCIDGPGDCGDELPASCSADLSDCEEMLPAGRSLLLLEGIDWTLGSLVPTGGGSVAMGAGDFSDEEHDDDSAVAAGGENGTVGDQGDALEDIYEADWLPSRSEDWANEPARWVTVTAFTVRRKRRRSASGLPSLSEPAGKLRPVPKCNNAYALLEDVDPVE